MSVLRNQRHEAFAQAIAKGKTATDAYAEAGYRVNAKTAAEAGSRLSRNVKVAARVVELQAKAAEKAEVTAKDVILGLHREATREGEGASHSARVAAWGLLGKYHNLFTDRIEAHVSADVNVNDARSKLEYLVTRQLAGAGATGSTGKPH